MSVQWDPRSYLVEAAARHLIGIDSKASATTIVNYFDSITTHLHLSSTDDSIREALSEQFSVASLPCSESTGATSSQLYSFEGVQMQVPFRIMIGGVAGANGMQSNGEIPTKDSFADLITNHFISSRMTFSPFERESELSLLSSSSCPIGEPIALSNELAAVLRFAFDLYDVSDKLFDPTWSPLSALFADALRESKAATWNEFLPPSNPSSPLYNQFLAMTESAGFHHWELKPNEAAGHCSVVKKKQGATLDLCALSKGFIVDTLFDKLVSYPAVGSCFVDWGGEIKCRGTHPTLFRPWVVGFVRPPKLKALFTNWQSSSEVSQPLSQRKESRGPQEQYLHKICLCRSTTSENLSCATSGDYMQVKKFGFTHLIDPKAKAPLRVSNDGLAGVTVLGDSCMVCDGLATTLMLIRAMGTGIEFLGKIRSGLGVPRALVDSSPVLGYYLYQRNNDMFLHDEDDEWLGQGDEERKAECDVASRRTETFDNIHKLSSAADVSQAGVNGQPITLLGHIKSALSKYPSLVVAATVRMSEPSSLGRLPVVHCVLLSSMVLLSTSELYFSLMKGSILYNYCHEAGQIVTLSLLTDRQRDDLEELRTSPSAWLMRNGTSDHIVQLDCNNRSFVVPNALAEQYLLCCVSHVETVGDHILCFCRIDGHRVKSPECGPSTSSPASSSSSFAVSQVLLLQQRQIVTSLQPQLNLGIQVNRPSDLVTSLGIPLPPAALPICSMAVLAATHRQHGRIGFPVLQVKLCSVDPPMITCNALYSHASQGLLDGRVHPQPLILSLLSQGGAGKRAPADPYPLPRDEDFLRYLPFSVFSPIPNETLRLKCSLTSVYFRQSEGDPQVEDFRTLVLVLSVDGIEGSGQGPTGNINTDTVASVESQKGLSYSFGVLF